MRSSTAAAGGEQDFGCCLSCYYWEAFRSYFAVTLTEITAMVDLTINARPRTIRLKEVGIRMERPAQGTITPGNLVALTRSDGFIRHPSAGNKCSAMFALENELLGLGIDDNYVSGDLCQVEVFDAGDWVLATVAAAATKIWEGDYLESDGAGNLRLVGADYQEGASAIAQAMETIDNSGGGTVTRIIVAIT